MTNHPGPPLAKNAIWYLLASVFLLNAGAQILFMYTRPRTPNPGLGKIFPLNVHGTVVYLTFWEHLITGGWSFMLIGVLIVLSIFLNRDALKP